MKVIGISTSPREQSNSDILLRRALEGTASTGANTEYLRLGDYKIAPCSACGACYKTGECAIKDDFQKVLNKMLDADRLIFATPIYFMSVCAQAKILIDRCQCLWATKYVLKRPIEQTQGRHRLAMVIAVGATKSKKMFESVRMTMKYWFDVLDVRYFANLFVNKIEEAGKIAGNAEAMSEAFRLGAELVGAEETTLEKTIDVEITAG